MAEVPELFLSGSSIAPFSKTYSSWRENYIVLHQIIFDIDMHKTADVVAVSYTHLLEWVEPEVDENRPVDLDRPA